nr:preprotein translocase subunit SecG [Anaplasma centrale]
MSFVSCLMFLTAAQVFLAFLLVLLVLLQSPESDTLGGFGGPQSNLGSMFGKSSSSSFIAKLTAVVAAAFIVNTILLVGTNARRVREVSVVSKTEAVSGQESNGSEVPFE